MSKRIIVGVRISNRVKEVPAVQQVFTEFGCNIRTRLGLHQEVGEACTLCGLIILEMTDLERVDEMERILQGIEGVEVQKMIFEC
ncbi:MAG TPA: hypothetical protein DCL60_09135 [Armatimonadetes bacterium]|jgi:hypothetical protein|nr:hypothetical protein [Armatimonadota bacterium]